MRNHYRAGANFERSLVNYLRGERYRVHRTAGSHTPIDVMAGIDGKSYGFQCQIDKPFAQVKITALLDECEQYGCEPWIAYREKRKLVMEKLCSISP